MPKCNTKIEDADIHEKDLSIGITFHRLGLILAAISGLIAIILAEYLIVQHARHYLKPWEQKHIIRILFMIPVYSIVSFLSYFYFHHAIYFEVLRDCYEAFAIASFFALLCSYIASNLHDQKEYFRTTVPKNWIWPLPWLQKCTGGADRGILRRPKSGLTWFNIIHVGVFQYCFVRVACTIISVLTQFFGRYCESSLSPAFAYVWVLVIESVSVTVAMYTLIQFYVQLKPDLAQHKPFLKLLSIKLVIFFSFWQNLVLSFLSSSHGPLKPGKYISWPDINVGIPSVLLTCEMAIFAVLHLFAYPWRKPYGQPSMFTTDHEALHAPGSGFSGTKPHYQGGFMGVKAMLEAFNPWDIIKASARGFRWLFVGVRHRHQDISYQKQATSDVMGGGAGEDAHGYMYDSTKLQPIAAGGGYPLTDTSYRPAGPAGPDSSQSINVPYGHQGYGSYEYADTRASRWDRHTDNSWTTDVNFTPSASPSPRPPGPYTTDHRNEDRARLLQHAAQAGAAGRTDHGELRYAAPDRAVTGRHEERYSGDEEEALATHRGTAIGVARTTDESGGSYGKDPDFEQRYRGYDRTSWNDEPQWRGNGR